MAQARQEEAHLGAIVETGSTARTPRNTEHVEAASNLHAVDVRAHEHRVIPSPSPTRDGVADLRGDPIGLVRRRAETAEGHRRCIARHSLWGELLRDAESNLEPLGIIEANEASSGGEHGARAAIVLRQDHLARIGISLGEVQNVADRRSTEAIDRLVVIADNGEIATAIREQIDQRTLQSVRILVLVYQDPAVLLPCSCGNKGVVTQQLIGAQHLIAKIEQATLVQDRAVGAQRCAELPMLGGEQIHRVGIRGQVPLEFKIGGRRCGTACLGSACLKICRELLNLIGAERLILGAREVAGDVSEESRRIPKRQETLEAQFKEMFAKEQNDFGAPQNP